MNLAVVKMIDLNKEVCFVNSVDVDMWKAAGYKLAPETVAKAKTEEIGRAHV